MQTERYSPVPPLSSADLPAKLRFARIHRNLTQQQMADRLGLKNSRSVRYIESGNREVGRYVERWANATNFPAWWFYA